MMDDVAALLDSAIEETRLLKRGEVFLVRDLFKGYLWNRISRGDRLLIGSLFLSYVSSHDCGVLAIEKGVSGQQRYKRI